MTRLVVLTIVRYLVIIEFKDQRSFLQRRFRASPERRFLLLSTHALGKPAQECFTMDDYAFSDAPSSR